MLVKKNKACEVMEKILGFGFEELEFVVMKSLFFAYLYAAD